jgi:2-oxoglutarate/2-oxoacid ferredoxin oxidoreductase subunit alpha
MGNKKINNFSWKVAGAAGDGVLSAGMLFAKTCIRGGLEIFATAEYPSLIRGGHNHLDVRVGKEKVNSHSRNVDLLVALNQDSIDYHCSKISPSGGIIYDGEETSIKNVGRQDIEFFDIPLRKIAEENGGIIMRNTIAMGATIGLVDFDMDLFNKIIEERFGKKSTEIIAANIKAAKAGYDFVKKNYKNFNYQLKKIDYKNEIMITGNEAISMGAIKAGCKFYSAYPMTPASSLLSFMAANEKEFGMVVKHTEDEIAAINMAIGASYAGARAMTGTSGGGFGLMVEALGLAAMTETPLVLVEAQRPGPASGMATHSGQGDLRFILHAAADEFPRVVIAPGDVNECFFETIRAFNLADKYQIPVIILTDKFLGESYWSTKEFDMKAIKIDRCLLLKEEDLKNEKDYRRYKITDNGVSPRARPGIKNGIHVASSYEHDEHGVEREEEPIRVAMHDKRFRKLKFIEKDLEQPKLTGNKDAELTIVSWGSTKGAILEALDLLKEKGIKANYLQFLYVSPFPEKTAKDILSKSKIIVDIEGNKTGQLAGLIKEHTGLDVHHRVLKYDGRAFAPEELAEALEDIAKKKAGKVIVLSNYEEKDLDKVKMRTFKLGS